MGIQGTMQQRTYIAIDLKSFYASVECVDRGLDPLTTNLVVADVSRTEKTIRGCAKGTGNQQRAQKSCWMENDREIIP